MNLQVKNNISLDRVVINNYKKLKNTDIKFNEDFSIVVGKNNTGKTSILSALDHFINKKNFKIFDVNNTSLSAIESKINECVELYNSGNKNKDDYEDHYELIKDNFLNTTLMISYTKDMNLKNIKNFLVDLEDSKNIIYVNISYEISFSKFYDFIKKVSESKVLLGNKRLEYFFKDDLYEFVIRSSNEESVIKSENHIYIEYKDLKTLINFEYVSANRDVNNDKTKTLSLLTSIYYEKIKDIDSEQEKIDAMEASVDEINSKFDEAYKKTFSSVFDELKILGHDKDSELFVRSMLNATEILKNNISVNYKSQSSDYSQPENYNGLGYMNLFTILFDVKIKMQSLFDSLGNIKSDLNILFIEEPEAYMHPQMQYIFINNIKKILDRSSNEINLQTVITTHSSHIVSQANFEDIIYLVKNDDEANININAKNLKDLGLIYEEQGEDFVDAYNFIKKYLTLLSSEVFFADKLIFIEGATERILLPAMMSKFDKKIIAENKENEAKPEYEPKTPLLSQNISVLEVGANSLIWKIFLEFLNIKTLILTDIDSVYPNEGENGIRYKACSVDDEKATTTSNNSIKKYLELENLSELKNKKLDETIIADGLIMLQYQRRDNYEYYPRSFEDAFLSINYEFFENNKKVFKDSLNTGTLKESTRENVDDMYSLVEKLIKNKSKSQIAIDIIVASSKCEDGLDIWETPEYIEEGLKWVQK